MKGRIWDIIIFLIIFNFVMTGLSALAIISAGSSYVEPGTDYTPDEFTAEGATDLVWEHIGKDVAASLAAGTAIGIGAHFAMGISGGVVISISLFAGMITSSIINTASFLWNIYASLDTSFQPAMGISIYIIFAVIGVLIAVAVFELLGEQGV